MVVQDGRYHCLDIHRSYTICNISWNFYWNKCVHLLSIFTLSIGNVYTHVIYVWYFYVIHWCPGVKINFLGINTTEICLDKLFTLVEYCFFYVQCIFGSWIIMNLAIFYFFAKILSPARIETRIGVTRVSYHYAVGARQG